MNYNARYLNGSTSDYFYNGTIHIDSKYASASSMSQLLTATFISGDSDGGGRVRATNGVWVSTGGRYSLNGKEWKTYTTTNGNRITFDTVDFIDGVWVAGKQTKTDEWDIYYSIGW